MIPTNGRNIAITILPTTTARNKIMIGSSNAPANQVLANEMELEAKAEAAEEGADSKSS